MNKANKILAVILVVQLVLLGVQALWPDSSSESSSSSGPLLANFDPNKVTQVKVTDDQGKTITVKKVDDQWILPDYGDYPVTASRVEVLMSGIKSLTTERLISQSKTSFRRLQVSDDQFVRLIEFDSDSGSHKLYLGKTGGGGTVHVRLDDQTQVYLTSGISSQDAGTAPSGWIDTLYFSKPSDQVVSLELQNAQGDFLFTKTGEAWSSDVVQASEELNQDNLTQLLDYVTSLRMSAPIGKELKDEFGLGTPQATVTIKVMETVETAESPDASTLSGTPTADPLTPTATPQMEEKEYSFQIGAELTDGVVIKASNSDYYVYVPKATSDRFTTKTRGDFVTLLPTATPEPTAVPETPVPMSTADLSVTPDLATAQPTAEPTSEPVSTSTPEPTKAP
jgi:hypothetical protein